MNATFPEDNGEDEVDDEDVEMSEIELLTGRDELVEGEGLPTFEVRFCSLFAHFFAPRSPNARSLLAFCHRFAHFLLGFLVQRNTRERGRFQGGRGRKKGRGKSGKGKTGRRHK